MSVVSRRRLHRLDVFNGDGTGAACNNDGGGICSDRSLLSATIPSGSGIHAFFVDGLFDGAGASSGAYTVSITRP